MAKERASYPSTWISGDTNVRTTNLARSWKNADSELPQNGEHYNLDERMRCESQLRTNPAAAPRTDAATVDAALVTWHTVPLLQELTS